MHRPPSLFPKKHSPISRAITSLQVATFMLLKLIIIAIVCLFCTCTNYSNKKGTESTVKWANIKDVNVQDVFDSENSTFIRLDTNEEAILSGNLKISVLDDEIFILDYSMNQVFRFSKNGQFKNKIGKMGSGPEEYIQPCDMHCLVCNN